MQAVVTDFAPGATVVIKEIIFSVVLNAMRRLEQTDGVVQRRVEGKTESVGLLHIGTRRLENTQRPPKAIGQMFRLPAVKEPV